MKKYNLLLLKNFLTSGKTKKYTKASLSIITMCFISACSSVNDYYKDNIGSTEKNSDEVLRCVQSESRLNPVLELNTINSYLGKTNIYYTPFIDNLTVSFDNYIPDEFFNEIMQYHDISVSNYPVVENTFGESNKNEPEIFFTKISYTDNNGIKQNLYAIKFFDEGEYFEKFKAKFSNYRIINDNFNEFVFLHELFHAEREEWMTEIDINVGEYFSDVSSVLGVSLKNNYSYEMFKYFYDSVEKARNPNHNWGGTHHNPQLWNDLSILPSKNEYKKFVQLYQSIKNENNNLNNYASFNEDEGCYVIDLQQAKKISFIEDNISLFFKEKIKNSIQKKNNI